MRFECPSCDAHFDVEEHLAGKRAKCRKCGTRFIIPDPVTNREVEVGLTYDKIVAQGPQHVQRWVELAEDELTDGARLGSLRGSGVMVTIAEIARALVIFAGQGDEDAEKYLRRLANWKSPVVAGSPEAKAIKAAKQYLENKREVGSSGAPTGESVTKGRLEIQIRNELIKERGNLLRMLEALPLLPRASFEQHWGEYPSQTVEGARAALDLVAAKLTEAARFMDRNVVGILDLSLGLEEASSLPVLHIRIYRTFRNGDFDAVQHALARTGENEFTFGYYDT